MQELNRRGWTTKRWTTRKGQVRGGGPFTKTNLHQLLTNVTYLGKVKHKTEIHEGEHTAIVDPETWQRVQALLVRNGRSGGAQVRNQFGALLKGLLYCVPCQCAMTPAHSTRNGTKRYRYYTCTGAQKKGWHTCPSKSIPAGEIEKFVVEQIRTIGKDPALWRQTFAATRAQGEARLEELATERRGLERDLGQLAAEIHTLVAAGANTGSTPDLTRLADLHERVRLAERRATEINEESNALKGQQVYECDIEQALSVFDPVWESLTPREQARIVQLLVERVDFDGSENKVSITFHPSGIQTLADELAQHIKEKSA